MTSFLRFLVGVSLLVPISYGDTLHVAVTGSDTTPDPTNPASPLASIAAAAGLAANGDVIQVGPGTFVESGILLDSSVMIEGAGAGETILLGAATPATAGDSIIHIETGHDVVICDLDIRNGNAAIGGFSSGRGGGIYNEGSNLTLRQVVLSDNRSAIDAGGGGGIFQQAGSLEIHHCTVRDNIAQTGNGGGLHQEGGTLLVTRSVFDNNRAGDETAGGTPAGNGGGLSVGTTVSSGTFRAVSILRNHAGNGLDGPGGSGGGLINTGDLIIESSWFEANHAGDGGAGSGGANGGNGGAFINKGTLDIRNSTLFDNSAGDSGSNSGFGGSGGAVDSTSTNGFLTMSHVTITLNSAGSGTWGGGYGGGVHANLTDPFVFIKCCILYANWVAAGGGGADAAGLGIQSNGFNNIGDDSPFSIANPGLNDQSGVDPLLGPIGDHGGFTRTMLPLPQSVVIDAVPLPPQIPADQRGFARGPMTAIGAVDPNAEHPVTGNNTAVELEWIEVQDGPDVLRFRLEHTQTNQEYDILQTPFLADLFANGGQPDPETLNLLTPTPEPGTGGPHLIDVPLVGDLLQGNGTPLDQSFFLVLIRPHILNPP